MIVAGVGHITIDDNDPFETGQQVAKKAIENLKSRAGREEIEDRYLFNWEDVSAYLFNWEDVPGNESERLLRFFSEELEIDWVENAEICKTSDGRTICIIKDENSAKIKIDVGEERATLKISSGGIYDLKVKNENGRLNIYFSENESERLLRFLVDDLKIDWVKNAEICKTSDGKTIHIRKDENYAEIKINVGEEKATLEIHDGGIYDLKVKNENGKLKICREDIKLAVVFSSFKSDAILRGLIRGVRSVIPAPLLGNTSTCEISTGKVTDNSIVCLVLASDRLFIGTGCASFDNNERKAGHDAVESAYDKLVRDIEQSWLLRGIPRLVLIGWINSIWKHLFLGFVLVFPSFNSVITITPKVEDLINGVKDYIGSCIPLIGGLAASSDPAKETRVFYNDSVLENTVACAVCFTLDKFCRGIGVGLVPTGEKYMVTEIEGRRNHFTVGRKIKKLGRKKAPRLFYERLVRYSGYTMPPYNVWIDRVSRGVGTGVDMAYLYHPFGFLDRFGILRVLIPFVIARDSLEFGISFPQDTTLYALTSGDNAGEFKRNVKESVKHAIEEALGNEYIDKNTIEAVFIFTCAIKKWRANGLGISPFEIELDSVKEELGLKDVPIIGFYTFGEMNAYPEQSSELLSHSFSVLILTNQNILNG